MVLKDSFAVYAQRAAPVTRVSGGGAAQLGVVSGGCPGSAAAKRTATVITVAANATTAGINATMKR